MKKVKWGIAMLWQMFMGFISPLWLGWMLMDITGHGKGYGYDLGSERDIWVLCGVMELVIWLIAVIPNTIWLSKQFSQVKKLFAVIPIGLFALFSGILILLVG